MDIAGGLRQAFVASTSAVPSPQELAHYVQKRLFLAFAAFVFCLACTYGVVSLSNGRVLGHANAVAAAILAVATVLIAASALARGSYVWPFRLLAIPLVAYLSVLTLQQGQSLPAAGWWLSIIPFILGGAGLNYLAAAVVVDFIAIVLWFYFGPSALPLGGEPVEEWRRVAAVIGSELLALGLIYVAMQSRAKVSDALEKARASASESGALKARFLANMSHEIRTPLTGIIGVAEVLGARGMSEEQRLQLVALQQQSARTLLALVNDILDYSKLEAGKVQLECQPTFLRDIVVEANELFSMQAFGKGIELSSSCNPDVPQVFVGDPVRLRQILCNLVSNAVKFTGRGGVHIHLAIDPLDVKDRATASTKRWVRLEVVDSGPGIAPAQLQTLFNAFVQGDASTTRRFGGTGLGLSISIELARLMGGRIEVRSVVDQGSSFSLVVPLEVAIEREPAMHPARRKDVVVATAKRGLERHLKSLFHDLRVDPAFIDHLPSDAELEASSLVVIDAPLLQISDPSAWLAKHALAGRHVVILTPLGRDAVVGIPADATLLYKPVRRSALADILLIRSPAPASAPLVPRPPALPLVGLHVLIAEDNAVNQIVVQAMLAELGATSACAGNGREALDYLKDEAFNVVLMDVHMPLLDGLATTRELRAREGERKTGRVTVLAMTATSESEDRADCLDAGMDGYLTKPFSLPDVRRALEPLVPKSADTETANN